MPACSEQRRPGLVERGERVARSRSRRRCRCSISAALCAAGLLGRARPCCMPSIVPSICAGSMPNTSAADQRDDDRAAAELAAAAARKAASASAADIDAAGIERVEPHRASVPLCACEESAGPGRPGALWISGKPTARSRECSCKASARSSPARPRASASPSPARSRPRAPGWCSTASARPRRSTGCAASSARTYAAGDLTRPRGVEAMMASAGPVDILVNNAGMQHVAPVEDFPPAKWDAIIALNLSAAFHTARLAVPHMKAQGWGRIICTASAHSLAASPFKSAYVAAKHGIAGLTKVLALELAEHGVTANCISPGYVWTPLVENQIPDTMAARGDDPRAGDRATSCWPSSRPRSSSSPRKSPRWPCSCAATRRRTSTARTTRSMAGGRRGSRTIAAASVPRPTMLVLRQRVGEIMKILCRSLLPLGAVVVASFAAAPATAQALRRVAICRGSPRSAAPIVRSARARRHPAAASLVRARQRGRSDGCQPARCQGAQFGPHGRARLGRQEASTTTRWAIMGSIGGTPSVTLLTAHRPVAAFAFYVSESAVMVSTPRSGGGIDAAARSRKRAEEHCLWARSRSRCVGWRNAKRA